jgi:hypothetical protein
MLRNAPLLHFVSPPSLVDQRAIIVIGGRFLSVALNPQPLPPRW